MILRRLPNQIWALLAAPPHHPQHRYSSNNSWRMSSRQIGRNLLACRREYRFLDIYQLALRCVSLTPELIGGKNLKISASCDMDLVYDIVGKGVLVWRSNTGMDVEIVVHKLL